MVLVWYYNRRHGFVLHGLWIGEIDATGKVVCLCNKVGELEEEPLYKEIISILDKLPSAIYEQMKTYWFGEKEWFGIPQPFVTSKDRQYPEFWIKELLKHGVHDGVILLQDYFEALVKLSQPLFSKDSLESLSKIMEDYKVADYPTQKHSRFDLQETISTKFGKKIDLKFKLHEIPSDPWNYEFLT